MEQGEQDNHRNLECKDIVTNVNVDWFNKVMSESFNVQQMCELNRTPNVCDMTAVQTVA